MNGNSRARWRAVRLIQRRELRTMLFGFGLYVVIALGLMAAILLLRNYLNFVQESGLLVMSGAFNFPLFAVIFLAAIYLAISSVTTIARERDQGTMEVLFYGPVDSISYVLGKYLAQMATYLFMLLVFALCFGLFAGLTNFSFPGNVGWVVLLSILVVSDVVAFSIFLSAQSSSVRTALFLFLSILLGLILIQFGREILSAIPVTGRYYNPVLFMQNVLVNLNSVARWVSPFSYLMQGMEAVRRGSMDMYAVLAATSVLFSLLFLGLSVVLLERKGVRR
ncbi:MAG: ABC transporter permease [Caldilineaceae bacterium]|nr:ABC transporter permease [Caldilineaceae bacterium]MCB0139411.1 ABC transporter permease [Caldilineaceae bacterium]